MPAPRVRSDFDALQRISGQFKGQADSTRQMQKALKDKMQVLQGKDWVGKGADKFYNEMNGSLLPAVQRLATAFDSASRVTLKISQIMKQAEDDATALFKSQGEAGGGERNKEGGWFDWLVGPITSIPAFGPKPTPVDEATAAAIQERNKEIQAFMDKSDARGALEAALRVYGYNTQNVNGEIQFGVSTDGEGVTDNDGTVHIGSDAFLKSPGWLASSVGHEILHANQIKNELWDHTNSTQGVAMNEVQAYDWELENAYKHGLTEKEVQVLQRRRAEHYMKLNEENRTRADNRNYSPILE